MCINDDDICFNGEEFDFIFDEDTNTDDMDDYHYKEGDPCIDLSEFEQPLFGADEDTASRRVQ